MPKIIFNTVKEYPDSIKVYEYKRPFLVPDKKTADAQYYVEKMKAEVKKIIPKYIQQKLDEKTLDDIKAAEALSAHRSTRRVRTSIQDIILCNKFEYFATFTFDPKKVDRFDPNVCKLRMSGWLHSQRYSHSPDLKYLIVPEFHKKCEDCVQGASPVCDHKNNRKAIHFHALLANYNGRLKDSGKTTKSNRPIYNLTGYRSGYSTAIPLDENVQAIANYVRKYITKDMPKFHGKKRYWCSKNLNRPVKTLNVQFDDRLTADALKKVYENDRFELFEVSKVDI